jgi:hypothetical protein
MGLLYLYVLAEDHFGFRKNRGTPEAILCLRSTVERSTAVNRKMCIALVDLLRAFDNVNWNITKEILKMIK